MDCVCGIYSSEEIKENLLYKEYGKKYFLMRERKRFLINRVNTCKGKKFYL